MDKNKIKYLVDIGLAASFIITAISGLAVFFFLPSQVQGGRFVEFLGITKGAWKVWHNWAGLLMIALVLVHLILNWRWIFAMTQNIFKKK